MVFLTLTESRMGSSSCLFRLFFLPAMVMAVYRRPKMAAEAAATAARIRSGQISSSKQFSKVPTAKPISFSRFRMPCVMKKARFYRIQNRLKLTMSSEF